MCKIVDYMIICNVQIKCNFMSHMTKASVDAHSNQLEVNK